MKIFELNASSDELGCVLRWVSGWARARESCLARLTACELGLTVDAVRAIRCEQRLNRAQQRFNACVTLKRP